MSVTITFEVDEGICKEIQRLGYNLEDYLNAILTLLPHFNPSI